MEAATRAREVLSRIKDTSKLVGVEVGISIGQMSQALLEQNKALVLYMVDSWLAHEEQPDAYKESGDWHARLNAAEQQAHYEHALKATEFAGERRTVMREPSLKACATFPDKSLSFVFLDADHSYEGASDDIAAWFPKVKKGGLICGHDYAYPTLPGVRRAVDEAVSRNKWKLELGENYTWFVRV